MTQGKHTHPLEEFDRVFPPRRMKRSKTITERTTGTGEAQHALAMFARAAQLDESTLPKALTWLSRKELLG